MQIGPRIRLDGFTGMETEQLRSVTRRQPSKDELRRLAYNMYDARRARERVLAQHLFGEPAWDMLLALYCLPTRGEVLPVASLASIANIAPTTSQRWQAILTREGLIEPSSGGEDGRRLTSHGRRLLEEYLKQLFYSEIEMHARPERAWIAQHFHKAMKSLRKFMTLRSRAYCRA